jgi:hypothetical protein
MTYEFVKPIAYINKGSTVEVPSKWQQAGITVSAVVTLVGSDKKLYLNKAHIEKLIDEGYIGLA